MLPTCPKCLSAETTALQTFTPICTAIGATAGVAISMCALNSKLPGTFPSITRPSGTALTYIAAAKNGAEIGKKIGNEIDNHYFPRHQCKRCLETFPDLFPFF